MNILRFAPRVFASILACSAAVSWAADPIVPAPPQLAAKSYVLMDATSGQVLVEHNGDERLPPASLTKLMTAYIATLEINRGQIREEDMVHVSEKAWRTGGSRMFIQVGTQVSVSDLLHGIIIQSGNDASVALAEHFGSRFPSVSGSGKAAATKAAAGGDDAAKANKNGKPAAGQNGKANESGDAAKADNAAEDAYNRFVAEMNREAARLGMKNSQYKNPHGLSAPGHGVSARDLLILAHAAMQDPLFRKYVSTREHKSKLTAADGSTREITWKNTNQLLGIAGYDGIKTGTTGPAGACLVSSGRLGDDHLLVAVLGSTSSDARYVDSRNLYRWAWKQRAEK